ncbi:NUDIX domain-containing protein [Muricoccus radiodurans]|uniref:NUDIX domain-containing protein n=1 Tax=Muricoccus radiodurans TaxID=2231721 RepID=UPI003CED538C
MQEADRPEVEAIVSRIVYENRWMRVREDVVRRLDGTEGIYGVVEKPDFMLVVPREDDGRLHLVQQFRYPVGGRFWEFPQGSWERAPEAEPASVALGELREETGLMAADMQQVGYLFEGYGYANQGCHIFLASGLRQDPAGRELEEQDLVTRAFAAPEVERMIVDGEIKDAVTVAAYGLLRLKRLL